MTYVHESRHSVANEGASAAFDRFVDFFCLLFSQDGFLADAKCRQSYRDYVKFYYRKMFGPNVNPRSARHISWYRRLEPILALPRGSRILDYGGGYGLDTIFLASLGYQMVFYEITPHHIGIARWLSERFGQRFGQLDIDFVLSGTDPKPRPVDAIFANEVAHHVEPAGALFRESSELLRAGGHLFLLEPNFFNPGVQLFFFKVRGFQTVKKIENRETGEVRLLGMEHIRPVRTWSRIARPFGFELGTLKYIFPLLNSHEDCRGDGAGSFVESWPIVRTFVPTHITMHFVSRAPAQGRRS